MAHFDYFAKGPPVALSVKFLPFVTGDSNEKQDESPPISRYAIN